MNKQKQDLLFQYRKLYWKTGGLISDAAIGHISRAKAAKLLDMHPREVSERIYACNLEAKQLMATYKENR